MEHAHSKRTSGIGDIAMDIPRAKEEVRQLEILAATDELRTQTEVLHELIANLESRLKQVCRSEPNGDGNEAGRSTSTVMGEFIYSQAEKVSQANNRLSTIMRLLEL